MLRVGGIQPEVRRTRDLGEARGPPNQGEALPRNGRRGVDNVSACMLHDAERYLVVII